MMNELPNTPERRGGHLERDPDGRWRVVWNTVAKAEDPPEPQQPVPFFKDSSETAIDGADQSKASRKKAKRDRKHRLQAERAAAAARAGINRSSPRYGKSFTGVEMSVDQALVRVAKAMVEQDYSPKAVTKISFWKGLVKIAEETKTPNQTREQSLAKAITTDTGALLYRAYRLCKNGPEPTTWDGCEPEPTNNVPATSPAYDEIARRASRMQAERPDLNLSFSQAFSRIVAERPELLKIDKAAHLTRVNKALLG
jgi:hypothetical protein